MMLYYNNFQSISLQCNDKVPVMVTGSYRLMAEKFSMMIDPAGAVMFQIHEIPSG